MREIKFRAWDKNDAVMRDWENLMATIYSQKSDNIFDDKGLIITQYTGLKDRNGKEIYEGDIVEWDDDSNGKYWRVAVVEMDTGIQFRIEKNSKHELSCREGYIFNLTNFIYSDTHNWLEIIGNIYKNKELLKQQ